MLHHLALCWAQIEPAHRVAAASWRAARADVVAGILALSASAKRCHRCALTRVVAVGLQQVVAGDNGPKSGVDLVWENIASARLRESKGRKDGRRLCSSRVVGPNLVVVAHIDDH